MSALPKLLITTKNNRGKKCILEILNKLLPYDSTANAIEVIKNVLVVNTILDPNLAFGLCISGPPSCAYKIYPIHLVVSDKNLQNIIRNIKKFLLDNYKNIKKFYVECFERGYKIGCRSLEIGLGLALREFLSVDYRYPDIKVSINAIPDLILVSFIKEGQEKVSVKSPNLNI
jgi:tRNA acetyltransferase TAN1